VALTASRVIPTEEQVLAWHKTLSNWGRWGKDDQLGALNLITDEKRRQAAALVREGIVISCARSIGYDPAPDAPMPTRHFILKSGEGAAPERIGRTNASDAFLIAPHGYTITHLDAPSHTFVRSDPDAPWTMYNGHPRESVTTTQGATKGSVDLAGGGIVSRGVLLDIARLRGVEWLEPTAPVFPDELDGAEAAQGVRVEPGDILLVRTGWPVRRSQLGPTPPNEGMVALQAACLPWLHERDVAILGSDTSNEVDPTEYPGLGIHGAVHGVAMGAMGMWLLDNAELEELAAVCGRLGRWEFQAVIAPLKLERATGCPVNPLALL
jgi:kynurenine formamidase